jgi:choline dehydrogenase
MQQYFAQLEHDHVVPPGTPGHGFSGPLDITVNGPEYLQNQTNAFKVLQATANSLGQNPANLSNILTYSDLNNNDADHDQQVGIFGCPAHRTVDGRRVSSRTLVVNAWNATNPDGSKKYPKFDVRLHAFATKILFDTSGNIPRYVSHSLAERRLNANSLSLEPLVSSTMLEKACTMQIQDTITPLTLE